MEAYGFLLLNVFQPPLSYKFEIIDLCRQYCLNLFLYLVLVLFFVFGIPMNSS